MNDLPAPIDASAVMVRQVGDLLLVTAPAYTVTLAATDGRLARLERGGLIADLFPVSACDPVANLLFGRIVPRGRLPVALLGLHQAGHGLAAFQ